MKRQPAQPHDNEPAFVLHTYAYPETSLTVEAFPPGFGYPLWAAYLAWGAVLVLLWPACQWVAGARASRGRR